MRPLPSRKLNKKMTLVWRLSAFLNLLIWGGLAIGIFVGIWWALASNPSNFDGDNLPASVMLGLVIMALIIWLVLFVVLVVIVPQIRWLQWSFEIYDEEIDIHRGIFWRRRIIIPLIRVQNVDTRQGPLMRMVGLASFTVATAAGEHEIPGLDTAEADATRDRVAVLARLAQEDV
ncbi:MAG: PH domain-containing protein [Actinomycetia bacterium]|nr:PH domain-containing protein [Actinomycetes bacterium]